MTALLASERNVGNVIEHIRLHISIRCRDIHNRGPRRITERANLPSKYFHIHFPPLVSHVIHSCRCESINTNTTLTVIFLFYFAMYYCIIHEVCLVLRHTQLKKLVFINKIVELFGKMAHRKSCKIANFTLENQLSLGY